MKTKQGVRKFLSWDYSRQTLCCSMRTVNTAIECHNKSEFLVTLCRVALTWESFSISLNNKQKVSEIESEMNHRKSRQALSQITSETVAVEMTNCHDFTSSLIPVTFLITQVIEHRFPQHIHWHFYREQIPLEEIGCCWDTNSDAHLCCAMRACVYECLRFSHFLLLKTQLQGATNKRSSTC